MYDSWHEGRTGNVCVLADNTTGWHEGRTGEAACDSQLSRLFQEFGGSRLSLLGQQRS